MEQARMRNSGMGMERGVKVCGGASEWQNAWQRLNMIRSMRTSVVGMNV